MARIVDVVLRMQDNMSSVMKTAESNFVNSSRKLMQTGKSVSSIGKTITNVGTKLTAGVTVPLAGLGAASVKNFGDVDKQMRLVQSTMGKTAWATGDLTGAMKKAAAESVYSMQDAADASLNFARQGFNAKQAADMLSPALSLAAATGTDLSSTTAGLGNTLKMFGAKSSEASKYADMFTKAQAQANTNAQGLFDAMSTAGSIVKTVGWDMSDLATITDVFGDAGISGSEGANALKTGLARLSAPASDGAKWVKKLGLNIFDSKGKMKDMVTVQGQLHDAFKGLAQEQKLQASSALFGKNQMAKWMTLINASPAKVKKYSDALHDAAGNAKNGADSVMSSVGGSIEKLKSTFDVFKYNVGKVAGTALKGFIDRLTELLNKFNNMPKSQQVMIVKMLAIAAAVGPVVVMFGKLVTGVGNVITNLGKLGKGIKMAGSLGKLILSPAGRIVLIMAAIATVTVLVIKNWDKIKAAMQKVGAVFSKAVGFIKKGFNAIGINSKSAKKALAPLRKEFEKLSPKLKALGKAFKQWFGVMAKNAKALWKVVGPVIKKIANVIGKVLLAQFKVAFSIIGSVMKSIGHTISTIIQGILQVFGGLIDFLTGVFTGNWKKAWSGVKEIFGGIFKSLVALVKAPMNAVISIINGAVSGINKLNIKIPDWVPGLGGKKLGFNVPKIPLLASGTNNWKGGLAVMNEKGGELVDLPRGSRVYPHDKSIKKAYQDGQKSGKTCITIKIEKIADKVTVADQSDLDWFVSNFANVLEKKVQNLGGQSLGYLY